MKKALLFALLVALPVACLAQDRPGASHGYVLFGAGGTAPGSGNAFIHLTGGGDVGIYKGLAAGGEIGTLFPAGSVRSAVGILSTNGSYHFRPAAGGKVVPFVTGGYTGLFREGWLNAANFGGGVTWWLKSRLGMRLEFRDHFSPSENAHLLTFRAGITFR